MNPNNFNDDGTIKKQADIRKYQHECLANHIFSIGDTIYVEK